MMGFLRRLLRLLFFWWPTRTQPAEPAPTARTIVSLLVTPGGWENIPLGRVNETGGEKYHTSSPVPVDAEKLNLAVREAEDWLAMAFGTRIRWDEPVPVESPRSEKIGLVEEVVAGQRRTGPAGTRR